ncbi:MAG: CRISPR-associated helicase Cas3' [Thermodesulfovibrio sp.]|nr:CRISPR-associated helicase Cas3' [Thermodesulfovibrio sp.]
MNAETLANKLRAKSEGSDILLKDHILQSLNKAKQLRDFVYNNNLEFVDMEKMFTSLLIALFIHDLGKISYRFQKKVYGDEWEKQQDLKDFLRNAIGLKDHEILSAVWSSILLQDDDEWIQMARSAILLHHYNEFYIGEKDLAEIVQGYGEDILSYLEFLYKNCGILSNILEIFRDYVNETLQDEFVKKAIGNINLSKLELRIKELIDLIRERGDLVAFAEFYEPKTLDQKYYKFMMLLGSLRRCDYSASGEVEIEFKDRTLKEIYSEIENRIRNSIKGKLWQDLALRKCNGNSAVLIAPTGSGKTEFALMWAKNTGKKLIYTLPLRVALNDLYKRFLEYTNYDKNEVVGLLHSTSFTEKLVEEEKASELDIENKVNASKLFSYPLMLSTPDQVFLASLNYYGSDKVISVFPLSAFVLDEIQSYNPEMAAIIIKTLKIIEKLGGKILVITATLPPYFKLFLNLKKRSFNLCDKEERILNEYKISAAFVDTEKFASKVKNYLKIRHKIKVLEDFNLISIKQEDKKVNYEIDKERVYELVQKIWKSGKKSIVFVLNNVSKAIKIYQILKEKYPQESFLLHSRMLEITKAHAIEKVKNKLNKKERVILVATQVIEASVNLDFDAMVTEISPIDSQIQRWGRVWRNRDKKYLAEEPNIYVFCIRCENGEFDRGTRAVYSGDVNKQLLKVTLQKLKEISGKPLNYKMERKLINKIFKEKFDGKKLTELYLREILKNLDFLNYVNVEKKSQAQKLFRNVAGLQVVVPAAMKKYCEQSENIQLNLANQILNALEERKEPTWDEIENRVGITKEKGGRWKLRKILIDFSVNIPVFYFENEKIQEIIKEFKGFYVLDVKEEDVETILEYGIDEYITKKKFAQHEEDEIDNTYYL